MKLTKQDLKISVFKVSLYFLFMLGLRTLIDIFNIEYSITTQVIYWMIAAIFWFLTSIRFDNSRFDSEYYSKIYHESLEIWASDRK